MGLKRIVFILVAVAIVVVTHDEMIRDRFDHIYHLRDGKLELDEVPAAAE
ncbi:MAG: hypothetical protein P8Z80_12945 [Pseudolabrys sp.]